jgi:hypothetical protein
MLSSCRYASRERRTWTSAFQSNVPDLSGPRIGTTSPAERSVRDAFGALLLAPAAKRSGPSAPAVSSWPVVAIYARPCAVREMMSSGAIACPARDNPRVCGWHSAGTHLELHDRPREQERAEAVQAVHDDPRERKRGVRRRALDDHGRDARVRARAEAGATMRLERGMFSESASAQNARLKFAVPGVPWHRVPIADDAARHCSSLAR